VHREYKDRGLVVYAVDIEEGKRTVGPWVEKNKLLEKVSEISAKQLLFAGVTSAADLGGTLKESLAIRDRIKAGAIPGPRM